MMMSGSVSTATEMCAQIEKAPTIESEARSCVQSLRRAQEVLDVLERQLRGANPPCDSGEPESPDVMSRVTQANQLANEIHRRINDLTAVVGGDSH